MTEEQAFKLKYLQEKIWIQELEHDRLNIEMANLEKLIKKFKSETTS